MDSIRDCQPGDGPRCYPLAGRPAGQSITSGIASQAAAPDAIHWPADNYLQITCKLLAIAGQLLTIAGKLPAVAGDYRQIASNLLAIAGKLPTIAGNYGQTTSRLLAIASKLPANAGKC